MDSTALEEEQIEDGGRLIEQLARDGFEVTGAFWVRSTNTYERQWFYVVSKTVDQAGLHVAYGAVHASIQRIPAPWGPALWDSEVSELKLVSPNNPLAQALLTLRDSHPGRKRFRGVLAGNGRLDEAYSYPSLGKADDESERSLTVGLRIVAATEEATCGQLVTLREVSDDKANGDRG